jgi:hypothetical protein
LVVIARAEAEEPGVDGLQAECCGRLLGIAKDNSIHDCDKRGFGIHGQSHGDFSASA